MQVVHGHSLCTQLAPLDARLPCRMLQLMTLWLPYYASSRCRQQKHCLLLGVACVACCLILWRIFYYWRTMCISLAGVMCRAGSINICFAFWLRFWYWFIPSIFVSNHQYIDRFRRILVSYRHYFWCICTSTGYVFYVFHLTMSVSYVSRVSNIYSSIDQYRTIPDIGQALGWPQFSALSRLFICLSNHLLPRSS